MNSQLIIRPSFNDHTVVADLLATRATAVLAPQSQTAPIDRLVVDAHIAQARPQFQAAAAAAGVPFVVDPLTFFWQSALGEDDRLAKLPYGSAAAKTADHFSNPLEREGLIEQVVDFAVEMGTTEIVAPYLYPRTPADPWFARSLELLGATRRRMDRNGLRLPLVAVLVAGHQGFTNARSWHQGIDRFARVANENGASALAIAFSPTTSSDSYSKVLAAFTALRRAKEVSGLPVYAWRQGLLGAGLVAAGLDGYETGIAIGEACNVSATMSSRRPKITDKKPTGGPQAGIYIEALGRSVPPKVGRVLLESSLRARVMCDDERCCPDGRRSTLTHPREHAVRVRARQLQANDALPHVSWRLHQLAKDAAAGSMIATQANEILKSAGMVEQLPTKSLEGVVKVARQLMAVEQSRAA